CIARSRRRSRYVIDRKQAMVAKVDGGGLEVIQYVRSPKVTARIDQHHVVCAGVNDRSHLTIGLSQHPEALPSPEVVEIELAAPEAWKRERHARYRGRDVFVVKHLVVGRREGVDVDEVSCGKFPDEAMQSTPSTSAWLVVKDRDLHGAPR